MLLTDMIKFNSYHEWAISVFDDTAENPYHIQEQGKEELFNAIKAIPCYEDIFTCYRYNTFEAWKNSLPSSDDMDNDYYGYSGSVCCKVLDLMLFILKQERSKSK